MPMTAFRRVAVSGPDIDDGFPLWAARLNLGAPFKDGDMAPVVRNFSIRLLLQAADPEQVSVGKKDKVNFHPPMLLSAAATTVDFKGADETPTLQILAAEFNSVELERDRGQARYDELHLAPIERWPDPGFSKDQGTDAFEAVAPRLRATRGVLRVGVLKPSKKDPLSSTLQLDWSGAQGGWVGIFGCLQIASQATLNPLPNSKLKGSGIAFDLVPEGVEFDARVADPFAASLTWLDVRLRLVSVRRYNHSVLRLDLLGGTKKSLDALWQGLGWMSGDLARRGGNLALQFDTRGVPPLSWPLSRTKDGYSCAPAAMIPEVILREDAVTAKLLTRTNPSGETPGLAELLRPVVRLAKRLPSADLQLLIEASSEAAAPPVTVGPRISLLWQSDEPDLANPLQGNPTTVQLGGFTGVAAVEPLAARLSAIWARSAAIAANTRPAYAFIALERGWVQLPLPKQPPEGAPSGQRASTRLATFNGF